MHVREVLMLSKILVDSLVAPKTIMYKITKGLAILADEKEACTRPFCAYLFAYYIPGANIEKCQEETCKDSRCAYSFAKNIPGADIGKCQEAACKNPQWAYTFAKNISGADVEKCRKACKGTRYAFQNQNRC